jgi:ribosomal-protein-alanine N-acetyltransferase
MSPVTIGDMSASEVDAVLAIDLASFAPHELGARSGEEVRAMREKQLREELARAWATVRVARLPGGAIAGYVLTWKVVDEIHLLNVAVAPEHRRAGVGRMLVEDVVARARESGMARILLEVRASNVAAVALYEALGFSRFNLRAGYYADGEDAVEMERVLSAAR